MSSEPRPINDVIDDFQNQLNELRATVSNNAGRITYLFDVTNKLDRAIIDLRKAIDNYKSYKSYKSIEPVLEEKESPGICDKLDLIFERLDELLQVKNKGELTPKSPVNDFSTINKLRANIGLPPIAADICGRLHEDKEEFDDYNPLVDDENYEEEPISKFAQTDNKIENLEYVPKSNEYLRAIKLVDSFIAIKDTRAWSSNIRLEYKNILKFSISKFPDAHKKKLREIFKEAGLDLDKFIK
jgi:hypothetical protein